MIMLRDILLVALFSGVFTVLLLQGVDREAARQQALQHRFNHQHARNY